MGRCRHTSPCTLFIQRLAVAYLWEQYAFDKNEKYLKEIYPVLKGASQFYLENLIEYKDTKKLVFWGTYSAEHNSSPLGVTEPNFQDIAFAGETFENTIKASEILNTDKEFRDQLMNSQEPVDALQDRTDGTVPGVG